MRTATFPEIFEGLVPIDPMNVRTKFEVRSLPAPEIIGGTQQIWAVPGYAHAHFLQNFEPAFVRIDPVNVPAKFEVRSFTRS